MLNDRLQILVRRDQRKRLEDEARRRGTSVASLVREAVDAHFGSITTEDRLEAVRRMGAKQARFFSPEELNQLIDQEHEDTLDAILHARR
mgnify:CR=1 FL=1